MVLIPKHSKDLQSLCDKPSRYGRTTKGLRPVAELLLGPMGLSLAEDFLLLGSVVNLMFRSNRFM